jgi:sugar (pentulose or hexulose) kinase
VGGPAASPVWPAIIESALGIRIKIGTPYAGAQGAALLAAIGAGHRTFDDVFNPALEFTRDR